MRQAIRQQGFLLLSTLLLATGLLGAMAVGLTRSLAETNATMQSVVIERAFQLAEAGLDDALVMLAANPSRTACPTAPGFTCTIVDQGDGTKLVTAVGTAPNGSAASTSRTVRARVRTMVSNGVFDYAVAGTMLNMDGNARIGDPFNRATVYLSASGSSLTTTAGNQVWATKVDFANPSNDSLATLCPRCDPHDTGVFPNPVVFHSSSVAPRPSPKIALTQYYNTARAQEASDPGKHYLTSDTLFTNATINGLLYVECGVTVTFKGLTTINGTIIHEGCGGSLELQKEGSTSANLIVNSEAATFQFGAPMAPGMAIVGAPRLGFSSQASIDITGHLMHDPGGTFAPTGTITGGFIGINAGTVAAANPGMVNNPGPGTTNAITWRLYGVHLGGSTAVVFKHLETSPPGLIGSSSSSATLLLWQAE